MYPLPTPEHGRRKTPPPSPEAGGKKCLDGISFRLKRGETLGIIGHTGAGKSTLIRLLMRFYDADEGTVYVDGRDVRTYDKRALREKFGAAFQSDVIFAESIRDNISLGRPLTDEELLRAAEDAMAADFIAEKPGGWDYGADIKGANFSGGQKQRLCIARAILKDAPILILDEATSAADPENQVEIDSAIENLCRGKTVLIVAHRLGAIKLCNQVAVVEEHTITARGPHDQVRRENGYYRKAWSDYETARQITYSMKGGQET